MNNIADDTDLWKKISPKEKTGKEEKGITTRQKNR